MNTSSCCEVRAPGRRHTQAATRSPLPLASSGALRFKQTSKERGSSKAFGAVTVQLNKNHDQAEDLVKKKTIKKNKKTPTKNNQKTHACLGQVPGMTRELPSLPVAKATAFMAVGVPNVGFPSKSPESPLHFLHLCSPCFCENSGNEEW